MKRTKLSVRAERSVRNSGTVRYVECQKNHAARIGKYSVDGCREYMPIRGLEGTAAAFSCAACGCHRNFHRREEVVEDPPVFGDS